MYVTVRPFTDIIVGVMEGAGGLIIEPYKGMRKKGLKGFGQGLLVGILGVPAKPIVGLADAFTHASMAFRDVASGINLMERRMDSVKRRRLPYCFGLDLRLNPFLHANCRSVQLLKSLGSVEEVGDCVVWSESLKLEAGRELYICCTTKRIMCFEVLKDDHGSSFTSNLAWSVPFPGKEEGAFDSPIRQARKLMMARKTVALRLVNAGHNGVALYILEGPDDKINGMNNEGGAGFARNSAMGMNQPHQQVSRGSARSEATSAKGADVTRHYYSFSNSSTQFSQFGKDEDTVNIFQKMGLGEDRGNNEEKGLGASSFVRTGTGGGAKDKDKDIKVSVVKAEFQHRQALLRIANVAHCLMEAWEEVDEDEMGSGGIGAWKFGEWVFEKGRGAGRLKNHR